MPAMSDESNVFLVDAEAKTAPPSFPTFVRAIQILLAPSRSRLLWRETERIYSSLAAIFRSAGGWHCQPNWRRKRALEAGATAHGVLDCVREIRRASEIPIVLYTYLNPIFQIRMKI